MITQYLRQKRDGIDGHPGTAGRVSRIFAADCKKQIREPHKRREFYYELLQLGLAEDRIPEETEILNVMKEVLKDGPHETVADE